MTWKQSRIRRTRALACDQQPDHEHIENIGADSGGEELLALLAQRREIDRQLEDLKEGL